MRRSSLMLIITAITIASFWMHGPVKATEKGPRGRFRPTSVRIDRESHVGADENSELLQIIDGGPSHSVRTISPGRPGARRFVENATNPSIMFTTEFSPGGVVTPSGQPYELLPSAAIGLWYDSTILGWRLVATQATDGWRVPLVLFDPVCDGETDDHTQIQAAFDVAKDADGTVIWPAKMCATATGVVVGGDASADTFVSIHGATSSASWLVWVGDDDGVALSLSRNKYFKVENFSVVNASDVGTTTGIRLTGPLTVGTQTLAGRFEGVSVSGFHVGIAAGSWDGRATSEMMYAHLALGYNDIGFTSQDYNTLDHKVQMLTCQSNGVCLQGNTGD